MNIKCPMCGGGKLHIVLEEATALNNPKEKRKTKWWLCDECGYKFRDLDDWRDEIHQLEGILKTAPIFVGLAVGVAILGYLIHASLISWVFLFFAVLYLILAPLLKRRINNDWENYDRLKEKIEQGMKK